MGHPRPELEQQEQCYQAQTRQLSTGGRDRIPPRRSVPRHYGDLMVKRIDLPIGLADSELLEYSRTGNEVTVQVRTWNDKKLVLRFTETIGVLDLLAGDFSELLQDHAETTDFLARALRNTYE